MDSAIAPDCHSASAERLDSSSVLVAKVRLARLEIEFKFHPVPK